MRIFSTVIICLLALSALACVHPTHASAQSPNQTLVQSFLDALNSKNKDTIAAFVKSKCVDNLERKIDTMSSVAQQGAPFKMLNLTDEGNGKLEAKLEDTNGIPVTLKFTVNSDGKISLVSMRAGGMAPSKDYSGWTDLATLEESIRSDTASPAMAIAMLHDGKVESVASGAREVGKDGKVTAEDTFSIGSVGKPLCSTVIGKLIEMGKLRWDETLAEALPNTPMKDAYKDVTIEQILHHRGGIPQEMGMRRPDVLRVVNGETDRIKIRENYAREILAKDPIGKPNEKFAYSNGGYQLLGHIAELTMGKPYEALVKEYIFTPLGMTHSYTGIDTLPTARPLGHINPDGPQGGPGGPGGNVVKQSGPPKWEPMDMNGPIEILFAPAGGGMFASAADLVKFGEMHMNGLNGKDGLLKAATIQRLHQGIPEGLEAESPSDVKPSYAPSPDTPQLYACGWGIESLPGTEPMHTHNGSNGTMRAQLAIFPKAGVVVAAFVNCGGEMEPSPPLQACLAIGQRFAKR